MSLSQPINTIESMACLLLFKFGYLSCSKVDDREDITIPVADSIPRNLNGKIIFESPWQKYVEKYLFMTTTNKIFLQS